MDRLEYHPLTPERWSDLETLFGPRGACGGCWCMWWRLKRSEFERQHGEANRQALRSLVEAGTMPGLLAYAEGQPVRWCAIEQRERYGGLERSRTLARVDAAPVWSVTCFFVARRFRRQGMMEQLLGASLAYAREHGARIVEGYPVEPRSGHTPDVYAYTGMASVFRRLGFVEVARRSETRPIMRYSLDGVGEPAS
jgi:GNAT superfamily N-acetyltransferase